MEFILRRLYAPGGGESAMRRVLFAFYRLILSGFTRAADSHSGAE